MLFGILEPPEVTEIMTASILEANLEKSLLNMVVFPELYKNWFHQKVFLNPACNTIIYHIKLSLKHLALPTNQTNKHGTWAMQLEQIWELRHQLHIEKTKHQKYVYWKRGSIAACSSFRVGGKTPTSSIP